MRCSCSLRPTGVTLRSCSSESSPPLAAAHTLCSSHQPQCAVWRHRTLLPGLRGPSSMLRCPTLQAALLLRSPSIDLPLLSRSLSSVQGGRPAGPCPLQAAALPAQRCSPRQPFERRQRAVWPRGTHRRQQRRHARRPPRSVADRQPSCYASWQQHRTGRRVSTGQPAAEGWQQGEPAKCHYRPCRRPAPCLHRRRQPGGRAAAAAAAAAARAVGLASPGSLSWHRPTGCRAGQWAGRRAAPSIRAMGFPAHRLQR